MTSVKKQFSQLLAGNVGVQVISVAFYPLLTRRYSPEQFGLFGVLNSIVQLMAIYSWGQLHNAIPTISNKEEQNEVYSLAFWLNGVVSLFILLVIFLIFLIYHIDPLYLLIPFALLGYGWLEIHKIWAVANDRMGAKTILINVNRLSSNILKLFGITAFALLISEIVSNLFTVAGFLKMSRRSLKLHLKWTDIKRYFIRFKDYPLFYSFYVLAQVLSTEAITLYLKRHLKEDELGLFYLGNKFFVQTALLLSSTLFLSFVQKLSRDVDERIRIYRKFFGLYFLSMIPVVLLSFFNYEEVVRIVFGEKWIDFSSVLTFFMFLTPLKIFAGFLAGILLLDQKIRFISLYKIFQFILLLILLERGFDNLHQFLMIFVPFEMLGDTLFMAKGYSLVKRQKLESNKM